MTQKELDKYKKWYNSGYWDKERVDKLYKKNIFTEEEYNYILGID